MLSKTKVKYIQSLGHKKSRQSEQMFIAEGPKIVNELLMEPAMQVKEIFATGEWLQHNHPPGHISVTQITDADLDKISQLTTPNQVLALVKQPGAASTITDADQWMLMLDGIRDPGNMGTIIRIADWFGISQLICSQDCADLYNPKVIQSSMASIARVQVLVTDLLPFIQDNTSLSYYAAVLDGDNITSLPKLKKGIIMIGNESKGLDENLLQKANQRITIPRIGKAESLNAAVATGIILSHLAIK